MALLIAALGFLAPVRRVLARVLPLDPESFVHTVALVLVTGLTLISIVPLCILSEPPLLMVDLSEVGSTPGAMMRSQLYGLMWLVPADRWGDEEHEAIIRPLDIAAEQRHHADVVDQHRT